MEVILERFRAKGCNHRSPHGSAVVPLPNVTPKHVVLLVKAALIRHQQNSVQIGLKELGIFFIFAKVQEFLTHFFCVTRKENVFAIDVNHDFSAETTPREECDEVIKVQI